MRFAVEWQSVEAFNHALLLAFPGVKWRQGRRLGPATPLRRPAAGVVG
jgi:hypothetical protein